MKFKYESTLKQITFVQQKLTYCRVVGNRDNKIKNCTQTMGKYTRIFLVKKNNNNNIYKKRINLYNLFKYTER